MSILILFTKAYVFRLFLTIPVNFLSESSKLLETIPEYVPKSPNLVPIVSNEAFNENVPPVNSYEVALGAFNRPFNIAFP